MQSLSPARIATRGLLAAILLASLGTGLTVSLVHCGESGADGPSDVPDASLSDGATTPEVDGGSTYRPCNACGADQICSDGQCADLPAQCPCPKGSYCDLGANRCTRGCIEEAHCSGGEYCDTEKRTCNIGCGADKNCKETEFCKSDTHVCTTGCRDSTDCTAPETCQVQGTNRFCALPWKKIANTPQRVESITAGGDCVYALASDVTKRPLTYDIHRYCTSDRRWSMGLHLPNAQRALPHLGFANNRVYIVGGVTETDAGPLAPTTRTTWWDRQSFDRTEPAGPLNKERNTLAVASNGNFLYALDHGSIESYFATTTVDDWTLTTYPRGTLDVAYPAASIAGDFLYATGGFNAQGAPTAQIWKQSLVGSNRTPAAIGTLRRPRGRHGLVAKADGTLYVFGGDATGHSVEVFPSGRELTPLPNVGNVIGAVVASDKYFYVVTDAGEMFTNAP